MDQPAPVAPAPVIDPAAGVERMMGNRALYLRVLARFRSDYRDAAAAMRCAFDAGDTDLAQRLAHTLKGAAGLIEARPLYSSALVLEYALRDGGLDARVLLPRLEGALADVVRELDGMAPMAQAAPPMQAPAAGNAVASLRAMLDIGDGAAVELVAAAHSELRAHLGEQEYAALLAAVADFDYERALELLERPGKAG